MTYPNNTTYQPMNKWNEVVDPTKWQPLCVLTSHRRGRQHAGHPDRRRLRDTAAERQLRAPEPGHARSGRTSRRSGPLDPVTHYPPQFQLPGPPTGTADVDLELKDASNLSETQKAKADYWADGPRSEFPPGHMAVFAQALSRMRKNTLDQDVKLFFVLGSSLLDASISSWAAKYQYDSVRPITAIRSATQQDGQLLAGPGQGLRVGPRPELDALPGADRRHPAVPRVRLRPQHLQRRRPHRLLQFYGNNDAFNAKVVIKAGSSKIEPGIAPAKDVTVTWKTLSDAADDAGWSRRWGGIHFVSGDQQGRALGRLIGYNNWNKAQTYFNGSATATT